MTLSGFLESLDDFYHLGSGMVMLQTTNNVFNASLYQYVHTESLLAWQRVRVANMMAHNGQEWAATLGKYNSGEDNGYQHVLCDIIPLYYIVCVFPQQPLAEHCHVTKKCHTIFTRNERFQ